MEIITTHDVSDFDGFASCVAVQRLYPEAVIVLAARISTTLHDYLALHKDRFRTIRQTDLDPDDVTRLVVVDMHRRDRLKALGVLLERIDRGEVEVHVWDHHGSSYDDLPATERHVEPVGSTTTLVMEELRRRGVEPDAVEATLYLTGIYADTGSLCYGMTTARDARAAAWLLERGASLEVAQRYLHPPFTRGQRGALVALLGSIELERVVGVDVGFAVVRLDETVDGLADVTSEAIDLRGLPALIALFVLEGRRVQVVGRARRPWVDVARVIEPVGGGGHQPAASAIVKHANVGAIRREILAALRRDPPAPKRVRDLMSSPVHTVPPDMPLSVLRETLRAWRHTGAPVTKDQEIVGIVSLRDADKVDDERSVPVSGCMTHRVYAVGPDEPVEDALARMEEHDVGRLPVVEDGELVGILTRSDLMRELYGEHRAEHADVAPRAYSSSATRS